MGHLVTDIEDVYKTYFGEPYRVGAEFAAGNSRDPQYGANINILGTDIMRWRNVMNGVNVPVLLPVTIKEQGGQSITIDCATIRVTGKRTIVRTPVAGRRGTVKEEYQVGDYQITIKGVLIGERRGMPDDMMIVLKEIYESEKPVFLLNALSDIFLDSTKQIAIESIEFPDVEGKTIRYRPFIIVCESDFVESIELSANA